MIGVLRHIRSISAIPWLRIVLISRKVTKLLNFFLYHYKLVISGVEKPARKSKKPSKFEPQQVIKEGYGETYNKPMAWGIDGGKGQFGLKGDRDIDWIHGVGPLMREIAVLNFPFIIHVVNKIPVASSYKSSSSVQIEKRICFIDVLCSF